MIYTPLYEVKNGIYHQRFKVGLSYIYSLDTDFNIIKGNSYLVTDSIGLDVEIVNEKGEKEIYSHEYFSMTKPY